MKIGFSFGRCIRDLVEGTVNYDDVLFIASRTRMKRIEDVPDVINEYMYQPTYLQGLDYDACVQMGIKLYESGKLHQYRVFDNYATAMRNIPNNIVWMDLVPTELNDSPVVKTAWEEYRSVLTLCSNAPAKLNPPEESQPKPTYAPPFFAKDHPVPPLDDDF